MINISSAYCNCASTYQMESITKIKGEQSSTTSPTVLAATDATQTINTDAAVPLGSE